MHVPASSDEGTGIVGRRSDEANADGGALRAGARDGQRRLWQRHGWVRQLERVGRLETPRGSTTQDDGSVDDTAPQAEGEGTEEAPDDSGTEAVSVKLPGLPVGGDHSVESSTLQCADVGWTTPPDFPDGVEIKITGVGFSPEESFELSSESCPGDAPPCLSDDFRLTGDTRCSVAVAWTGEGSGTDDGGSCP